MSTLHERLLADLKGWHIWAPPEAAVALSRQEKALRAAIELHAPRSSFEGRIVECLGCDLGTHPEDRPDWPCSTITAIADALGVEIGETP